MKNLILNLGIGALFTHELDAMTNHEWRVLPLTSFMGEELGRDIFVLLHIPMFALIIGLLSSPNQHRRQLTRLVLATFLAVHGLLHHFYSDHVSYEFSSPLSNTLILLASVCGLGYLFAHFIQPRMRNA